MYKGGSRVKASRPKTIRGFLPLLSDSRPMGIWVMSWTAPYIEIMNPNNEYEAPNPMAYRGKMGATNENPRTATKTERYRGKRELALSSESMVVNP